MSHSPHFQDPRKKNLIENFSLAMQYFLDLPSPFSLTQTIYFFFNFFSLKKLDKNKKKKAENFLAFSVTSSPLLPLPLVPFLLNHHFFSSIEMGFQINGLIKINLSSVFNFLCRPTWQKQWTNFLDSLLRLSEDLRFFLQSFLLLPAQPSCHNVIGSFFHPCRLPV